MSRNFIVALALLAGACGASDTGSSNAAIPVDKIVSDTDLLREMQAAANDIVRNAADCNYVTSAAPDFYRMLGEAEGKVQTEAGKQSLETVQRQVDRIAETCGAR
ncbi:MAG TPA: hypothetical protein VEK15_08985 [Vicinamibacteria bacterium]|nr:hypothetical protein [Vicinamibacteria bacterium]